jgi:hypothetical protein
MSETAPTPPPNRARLRALATKTAVPRDGIDRKLVEFVVDPVTQTLRVPRPVERVPLDPGSVEPRTVDGFITRDPDFGLERVVFELRAPTLEGRGRIQQASIILKPGDKKAKGKDGEDSVELDLASMQLLALIECCVVPATGPDGKPTYGGTEAVFTTADLGWMKAAASGSHVDVLAKAAGSLVNPDAETVGKG